MASEFNPFATAVGTAILEWQKVEYRMAQLFSVLLGHFDDDVDGLVYHRLGNANGKLLAIDALVQFRVKDKRQLVLWAKLLKRTKKAVEKRNDGESRQEDDCNQAHLPRCLCKLRVEVEDTGEVVEVDADDCGE